MIRNKLFFFKSYPNELHQAFQDYLSAYLRVAGLGKIMQARMISIDFIPNEEEIYAPQQQAPSEPWEQATTTEFSHFIAMWKELDFRKPEHVTQGIFMGLLPNTSRAPLATYELLHVNLQQEVMPGSKMPKFTLIMQFGNQRITALPLSSPTLSEPTGNRKKFWQEFQAWGLGKLKTKKTFTLQIQNDHPHLVRSDKSTWKPYCPTYADPNGLKQYFLSRHAFAYLILAKTVGRISTTHWTTIKMNFLEKNTYFMTVTKK